jgi:hypothetical protein
MEYIRPDESIVALNSIQKVKDGNYQLQPPIATTNRSRQSPSHHR